MRPAPAGARAAALVFALAVAVASPGAPAAVPPAAPADPRDDAAWSLDEVDALVGPLVRDGWVAGLGLGLLDGDRKVLRGYGRFAADDPRAPAADTLYEIGSVTKVLTGVLLASAVQAGEARADEPVADLLPAGWAAGARAGPAAGRSSAAPITLLDLTTHTSGLPRLPSDLPLFSFDPYAAFDREAMAAAVGRHGLVRVGDPPYAYSNFAVGLLGFALAHRAGSDYESLLRARVCAPLGLDDTLVTLDDGRAARLAPGHDAEGRAVGNWHLATLVGAGGVRSTAGDMLVFAEAALGRARDPAMRRALALSMVPRRPADADGTMVAFGWHVRLDEGLWTHSGQTGGYHAFLAVHPERDQAVVVLGNTATDKVSELGQRLLELLAGGDPRPLDLPIFLALDAATLPQYVGRYAGGGVVVEVVAAHGGLQARMSEPEPVAIHAVAPDAFVWRHHDARLTFLRGDDGAVRGALLARGGRDAVELARGP